MTTYLINQINIATQIRKWTHPDQSLKFLLINSPQQNYILYWLASIDNKSDIPLAIVSKNTISICRGKEFSTSFHPILISLLSLTTPLETGLPSVFVLMLVKNKNTNLLINLGIIQSPVQFEYVLKSDITRITDVYLNIWSSDWILYVICINVAF